MKKQTLMIIIIFSIFLLKSNLVISQELVAKFGKSIHIESILSGTLDAKPVNWYQVNTKADTWNVDGDILKNTGLPIGVIRSEKEYENFIMHIEWSHQEPGGNSGVFVWSRNLEEIREYLSGVPLNPVPVRYLMVLRCKCSI